MDLTLCIVRSSLKSPHEWEMFLQVKLLYCITRVWNKLAIKLNNVTVS